MEKIIIVCMIFACILYVILPAIYYIVLKLIIESHESTTWIIIDAIQITFVSELI